MRATHPAHLHFINLFPNNKGRLFYPNLMTPAVEGYPGRCRILCNKSATLSASDERNFLCSMKSTNYENCLQFPP